MVGGWRQPEKEGKGSMRDFMRQVSMVYLEKDMIPFYKARAVGVPEEGWLRELRRAHGFRAADIARQMQTGDKMVFQLERSEKAGSITLKKLREAADAMDCDVVYGVIPRDRTQWSKGDEVRERLLWRKRMKRVGR